MKITDYTGTVIDFDGTAEEAMVAGYNVNCDNCTNCRSCIDCLNCTGCAFCKECIHCKSCAHCQFCTKCNYCSSCTNCHQCHSGCTNCSYCTDCMECYDCNDCVECSRCMACRYCTNCKRCRGITKGVDCKQQPLVTLQTPEYPVVIRHNYTMHIGCQSHAIVDWMKFSDDRINSMSPRALNWWKTWKPVIQAIVQNFPPES